MTPNNRKKSCVSGLFYIHNNNELINVEQQQQFTMLVLFLVCLIIMVWCFYPLMIIGYTTTDDVGISLSNFSDFLKGALSSGRVTWVIAVPFEIAGSMNGDNLLAKMPRMLGLIALLFSIFHLLRELTSDTKFALLTPTLFAALWQNSWQHNGITSYPMLFTLSLACLFLSASLYNRFIKTNNVSMGIASATLLFCSFTSELFVSLAWIHFLIYSINVSPKTRGELKRININNLIRALPFVAPITIFLITFIVYSKGLIVYPLGDSSDIASTLITFTISGFPIRLDPFEGIANNNNYDIFKAFGKALLVILAMMLYSVKSQKVNKLNILILIFILSLLFSVYVNVPIALTQRYQSWVKYNQATIYIYTVFSTIGFVASIATLVVLFSYIKGVTGKVGRLVLYIGVGLNVAGTALNNQKFFIEQQESQDRWKLIDNYAKTGVFNYLPADSLIVAPALFRCYNIVCPGQINNYWTEYIYKNFDLYLNIADKITNEDIKKYKKIYFTIFEINDVRSFGSNKFKCQGRPKFQSDIVFFSGFTLPEECGSIWTEEKNAEVVFSGNLPRSFKLRIYVNGAFGPNVHGTFKVIIGNEISTFTGSSGISQIDLPFQLNTKENIIRIISPNPTSPASISGSTDSRKIGVNIQGLEIIN